jgi:hypothetical protein
MTELQAHPAAELFPLLSGDEYESFKKDIAENGLLEPIWLCDGKILDGRNRYRACSELGLEPAFQPYRGESPVAFAWSMNGTRRHLSTSQLAAIGARMLPALETEARRRQATSTGGATPQLSADLQQAAHSRAAEQAGEIVGVSARSIYKAKSVLEKDPETFKRVETGEITVNHADEITRDIPRPESAIATSTHRPLAKRIEEISGLAAQGHRASQIAEIIGVSEGRVRELANSNGIQLPDHLLGKVRRIDVRRVIESTVDGLEGTRIALDTIWGNDWGIEATEAKEWCESLTASFKALNRLRKELQEIARGN